MFYRALLNRAYTISTTHCPNSVIVHTPVAYSLHRDSYRNTCLCNTMTYIYRVSSKCSFSNQRDKIRDTCLNTVRLARFAYFRTPKEYLIVFVLIPVAHENYKTLNTTERIFVVYTKSILTGKLFVICNLSGNRADKSI